MYHVSSSANTLIFHNQASSGFSLSSALISKTNIEVESMKKKISKQENLNQSLEMKISELASLDNVEAVATTQGLQYNNSNIKVISK